MDFLNQGILSSTQGEQPARLKEEGRVFQLGISILIFWGKKLDYIVEDQHMEFFTASGGSKNRKKENVPREKSVAKNMRDGRQKDRSRSVIIFPDGLLPMKDACVVANRERSNFISQSRIHNLKTG